MLNQAIIIIKTYLMKGRLLYNLEQYETVFCPKQLKEMLSALKNKNLEINRHLKIFINGSKFSTTAKNIFSVRCKACGKVKMEIKTYN